MSITVTRDYHLSLGNMRGVIGTYTDSSAGTADDVNTGLHKVYFMSFVEKASGVSDNVPSINETFPCDGSAVTMICDASQTGYWFAIGV
jgi:hypothetical protein